MEGSEITEDVTKSGETNVNVKKKIFVAGATGNTGKRVVEQLLGKGFAVKAGVRDLDKVQADVTEGSAKLAETIGDDSEAVICATGYRPGWDLSAPWKAEQYIRKSGIDYTTIRPGGLRNEPPTGNIVMEPEDTLYEGTISRDQVAEVAVESLVHPESSFKVVEIVSHPDAPKPSFKDLFGSIKQK